MVSCPSCGSSRIISDYKPAPFLLRLMGVRALLCDSCNRQFRAFSIRKPGRHLSQKAKRKADVFNPAPPVDLSKLKEAPGERKSEKPRKINLKDLRRSNVSEAPVDGELLPPKQKTLRTRITCLYELKLKQLEEKNQNRFNGSIPHTIIFCPECNSRDVKQRRRKGLERMVFSITDHKAFDCNDCGATFFCRERKGTTGFVSSVS